MQNTLIKRFLWLLGNYAVWADYRQKESIMHTKIDLSVLQFSRKFILRLTSSCFFLTLIGQASLLLVRNSLVVYHKYLLNQQRLSGSQQQRK